MTILKYDVNATRPVDVEGITYDVPHNVYRGRKAWYMMIRGQSAKTFSDSVYGGTYAAFVEACHARERHFRGKVSQARPVEPYLRYLEVNDNVYVYACIANPYPNKGNIQRYIGRDGYVTMSQLEYGLERVRRERLELLPKYLHDADRLPSEALMACL